MKAFHLQARRLIGPLSAPVCDDRVLAESESHQVLRSQADRLAADGFTVWIFRRVPGRPTTTTAVSRLVDRVDPPAADGRESTRPQPAAPWPRPAAPGRSDH